MQGPVSLARHRIDLICGLVCTQMRRQFCRRTAQVRSVNLKKLACSLPGLAQIDSLAGGAAILVRLMKYN